MANRKDTASKRLQAAIDFKRKFGSLYELHELYLPTSGDRPTTLPSSLLRAFAAFGLDPKKPSAWVELLAELSNACFPDVGRPGRRQKKNKKWSADNLCQLLEDYNTLKVRHPRSRDVAICELIRKDKKIGARYRNANQSAETLRRNLQYARDPEKNEYLRISFQAVKGATEIIVRGQGAEITGEIQNRILEFSRKQGLARVSDVWKRMRELSSVT